MFSPVTLRQLLKNTYEIQVVNAENSLSFWLKSNSVVLESQEKPKQPG